MSEEAVLRLEAIERRYGRGERTIDVLNGVELSLKAGESVALIAPSGAGKSTLLHIAGLLERPDAGEVHVGGRPTSAMTDKGRTALRRSEIGFVYQFHHLLPEFSALENVVLPQMIAGLNRAEAAARARELLGYPRPRRAREPSPGRAVGRRAAARGARPRARQRAARPAGRQADRQSRPQNRRPRIRHADLAGQSQPRRRTRRHPQPGPGGADG